MAAIRLIVGLANPGAEYAATRHNAGAWFAERVAQRLSAPLRSESKFFGLYGRAGDVHILLPQTFMNLSGRAVGALAHFYKILPDEILVAHDELDLAPGVARLKLGGGHGGHNGLRDIHAALTTPDYWRLRVGIGHPGHKNEVATFVLKPPRKEEQTAMDTALDHAETILPDLLAGRFPEAMKALHTACK